METEHIDTLDDLIGEKRQVDQSIVDEIKNATDTARIGGVNKAVGQSEESDSIGGGEGNGGSSDTVFDPSIHCTDSEGRPVKNKDGSYRKKRGRKKLADQAEKMSAVTDVHRISALGTVQAVSSVHAMFLGPEWLIEDAEKRKLYVEEVSKLYAYYGVDNLPPWAGVSLLYVDYVGSNLTKPETKMKTKDWFAKAKFGLSQWWKGKRREKPDTKIEEKGDGDDA